MQRILLLALPAMILILASCGESGSPTGGGDDPPSIASWTPASGSTVSPNLSQIVIDFSESILRESFEPEGSDARLIMSMAWVSGFDDPGVWNADSSRFTVDLGGLPPGSQVYIDMGPFLDTEGNSSENPEPYLLEVSGEKEWFFWDEGFLWYYVNHLAEREEPELFRNVAESSSIGDFKITTELPIGPDSWQGDWARYFQGDFNDVDYMGFSYWHGSGWTDNLFEPPQHFFQPEGSWQEQSTVSIDFGQGSVPGTMDIDVEVVGHEDLVAYISTLEDEGDGPGDMILPDCAILAMDYTLTGEYLGDPNTVFRSGADTLWICAGVGLVRERSSGMEWNHDAQELAEYRTEYDLMLWGPEGFELPE